MDLRELNLKNVENTVNDCLKRTRRLVQDFRDYAEQFEMHITKRSKGDKIKPRTPKVAKPLSGKRLAHGDCLLSLKLEDWETRGTSTVQRKPVCLSIKKSVRKRDPLDDGRSLSALSEEAEKSDQVTRSKMSIAVTIELEGSPQGSPNDAKATNATCGPNCAHVNESIPSHNSEENDSASFEAEHEDVAYDAPILASSVANKKGSNLGSTAVKPKNSKHPILVKDCGVVLRCLPPNHKIFQPKVVLKRLTKAEIEENCGASGLEFLKAKSGLKASSSESKSAPAAPTPPKEARVRFCSLIIESVKKNPVYTFKTKRTILKTPIKPEKLEKTRDEDVRFEMKDFEQRNPVSTKAAIMEGIGVESVRKKKKTTNVQVQVTVDQTYTPSSQLSNGKSPWLNRKTPKLNKNETKETTPNQGKSGSDQNEENVQPCEVVSPGQGSKPNLRTTKMKYTFKTSVKSRKVMPALKMSPYTGRVTRSKKRIVDSEDCNTPRSTKSKKEASLVSPGSRLTLLIESFRR